MGSLQTHVGWGHPCQSPNRKGGVATGTSFKRIEFSGVSGEPSGMDDGLEGDDRMGGRGAGGRGWLWWDKRRMDKVSFAVLSVSCQSFRCRHLCTWASSLPAIHSRSLGSSFPSSWRRPSLAHSLEKHSRVRITSAQGGAWRTKQPLTALSGNDSTPFRNGSRGKIHGSNLIIFASCLQRV